MNTPARLGKCEWGDCPKRARRRDPNSGGYAPSYYMNLCGEHYRQRKAPRDFPKGLSALLKLHRPYSIYGECNHEHEVAGGEVVQIDDIGLTCEKAYDICYECCTWDGEQTETCAEAHAHGPGKPICKTRAALNVLAFTEPLQHE